MQVKKWTMELNLESKCDYSENSLCKLYLTIYTNQQKYLIFRSNWLSKKKNTVTMQIVDQRNKWFTKQTVTSFIIHIDKVAYID
jgi:hypothetical protein